MDSKAQIESFVNIAKSDHKSARERRAKAKNTDNEFIESLHKQMQSYHEGRLHAFLLVARSLKGWNTMARTVNARRRAA